MESKEQEKQNTSSKITMQSNFSVYHKAVVDMIKSVFSGSNFLINLK